MFSNKAMRSHTNAYQQRMELGADKMSLRRYPHDVLPALNQTHTTTIAAASVAPPDHRVGGHELTHPVPVAAGAEVLQARDDPVLQLVRRKEKYLEDLSELHTKFKYQSANRNAKRLRSTYPSSVNLHLVTECAAALGRDPDPHFRGEYDWYSTGSTLAIIDDRWLLHVHTRDGLMSRLKLSKINHKKKQIEIHSQNSIDQISNELTAFGNIHELRAHNTHLSVRQKHRITIVDPIDSRPIGAFDSELPFVSSDFDANSGAIITSDVRKIINTWDLETHKPILTSDAISSTELEPWHDPWSCVRHFGPHTFAFADRRAVRLFDTRQPITDAYCTVAVDHQRLGMADCEVVSCLEMVSTTRLAMVLGTTHKLFAVDMRIGQHDTAMVQWMHQLRVRPTMLSATRTADGDGEIIFAGSQLSGDIRLCETKMTVDDQVYSSPFLMVRPKTLVDSLQEACRHGHMLDATSGEREHIDMCTTGLVQWRSHLIMQNSVGDLFAQRFATRQTDSMIADETEQIVGAMSNWKRQLAALPSAKDKFYTTEIADFGPVAMTVRRLVREHKKLADTTDEHIAVEAATQRWPRWRQSAKRINSYVDALTKGILSVWDLPLDGVEQLPPPPKASGTASRIASWLENSVVGQDVVEATPELNVSHNSSIGLATSSTQLSKVRLTGTQTVDGGSPTATAERKPPKKKVRQSRVFVPGF